MRPVGLVILEFVLVVVVVVVLEGAWRARSRGGRGGLENDLGP
jgi:hypothetical protein